MRILTIYAHHNPQSFCHAVLERFCAGLKDAGHTSEVVDLHAIRFDPVFSERDAPNWVDDSVPDDVLAHWDLPRRVARAPGNVFSRWLLRRWMRGLDARGILRKLRARGGPSDVALQQQKVARADALVFIAPVYFVGFPAILKGWIERVFTLGFAFELTAEAWRGDVRGRQPRLHHKKALIISTTIWDAKSYEGGLAAAMKTTMVDYSLMYPGVQEVEHVYFHAVTGADEATRAVYLERAYALGRNFDSAQARAAAPNALQPSAGEPRIAGAQL